MTSLFDWVLSLCKNDAVKAERMINDLKNKALELDQSSNEEDSDYEPENESASEEDNYDVEEEVISITRSKDGFYKIN